MSVEITVKGGRVRFPEWSMPSFTTAWRKRVAPAVLEALRREAPVYKYDDPELSRGQKKGDLRASIKLDAVHGSEMEFTADVPYAKYVISGTGPHPIEAKESGPLLHWVRSGNDNYRRRVWHRGTAANDFPRRALDSVEPLIGRTLVETVRELTIPEQL